MGFNTAFARESFELFQKLRDEIKHNGMNQTRYNAIAKRLDLIREALSDTTDPELGEIRAMGASLISRQRLM